MRRFKCGCVLLCGIMLAQVAACTDSKSGDNERRDARATSTPMDASTAESDASASPDLDASETPEASTDCKSCTDGGSDSSTASMSVCDGSNDVRLVANRMAGGTGEAGSVVYLQMPLLVVDGHCNLYLLPDEWSELRTKALSPQEEAELKTALHVDDWTGLAGSYCNLTYDGARDLYWFAGTSVRDDACFGKTLPAPITWRSVTDYIASQYGTAKAVDDALWYTLVKDSGTQVDYFKGGAPWPLAGDPAMLSPASPMDAATIHRAEGDDASTLRDLRRKVLAGKIGRKDTLFIPIVQGDGTRYQLRIRDATPFDGEKGFTINLD